jgi:TRAP-type C4-dicarboxylate transport system substrate-binding protein
MKANRIGRLALMTIIALAAVACTSGGAATQSRGQTSQPTAATSVIGIADPPITLRVAAADGPSPEMDLLVNRVAELSAGRMTVTPVLNAGGADYETGVIRLVKAGDVEIALVATRGFDLEGITSLRFLQAPFLIDNDALALAVAKSDAARRALDAMGDVVGLTLWPLEVRHFQSFPGCDKDFRTPAGLHGATIFSPPSGVSHALAATLGAKTWFSNDADRGVAVDRCELEGAEAGITSTGVLPMGSNPTAVADVALFPKYNALVVNADTFRRLSDAQRAVLRRSAGDVQADAITRQSHDAGSEGAWCEAGGRIVHAGPKAQAAFLEAAAPVYDELEADSLTRNLIADVRALAAATPASPVAEPCEPSAPPTDLVLPDDLTNYVATPIPDGTYRRELVLDELIANGVSRATAEANSPTRLTLIYEGSKVSQIVEHEGVEDRCDGAVEYVDGVGRSASTSGPSGCQFAGDFLWRPEPDGISFVVIPHQKIPREDRALLDHWVWTRIN